MSRLLSFLFVALSVLSLPIAPTASAQNTEALSTADYSTAAFSQLICQRLDSLVRLPLMERSQL